MVLDFLPAVRAYWEIGQAPRDRPPWAAVLGRRGVKLGCPACRSALTTTWHGGPGIPFTDRYRRRTGAHQDSTTS
jgi:hypothetical protein